MKLKGAEELKDKLKPNVTMNDVKKIVKMNGTRLTQTMKRRTKYTYVKGYSTGDTASSINLSFKDGGLSAVVGARMDYNPYTEYGTRKMAPEPICEPSLREVQPQFLSDLRRVMK